MARMIVMAEPLKRTALRHFNLRVGDLIRIPVNSHTEGGVEYDPPINSDYTPKRRRTRLAKVVAVYPHIFHTESIGGKAVIRESFPKVDYRLGWINKV